MSEHVRAEPRPRRRTGPRISDIFRNYRLIRYVKPYRGHVLLLFLLILVYAGCHFATMAVARRLLNEGLWQSGSTVDLGLVSRLCLMLVGIAVVLGVSMFLRAVVKAWIVSRAAHDVRRDLAAHLMTLDLQFFHDRPSGEIISRQTSDIVAGTQALSYLFDSLLPQPFIALAYAAAAFSTSWKLALICLVGLPVLALSVARLAKRVRRYGRERLERIAELTALMSEIYHGIRVAKAFRIEERKREEFSVANERYISRLFKMMKLRGRVRAMTETFVFLILAPVMYASALMVRPEGLFGLSLSPGDVTVFAGAMFLMYKPIKTFAAQYSRFAESIAASERVFQLLDIQPQIKDAPGAIELPPIQRSLAFRDVSFSYGGPMVLRSINFEVARGQVTAIVGHSGSGKSTLLDLIPRFYDPTDGGVEIDGVDIRTATLGSLRDQIAIVSQEPFLFQASVADNIRYGRLDATDDEIEAAARAANIHDFIAGLDDRYDTICGERGVKLSGGQRQRLTIARAILKDAPILILDEATSSLDAESQRLVRDALRRLMAQRTTFVIAHRLSTVQHADVLVVLREGRVVEMGTHADLLAAGGEYFRLYQTEFDGGGVGGDRDPESGLSSG
jgi:subfamily B ATP-binding cassette protein MsbA